MVRHSVSHGTHTGPENGWSTLCVGSRDGSHRMRQMGDVRGPRNDGCDCDRPVQLLCSNGCGFRPVQTCNSGRGSKCGPCSNRNRLRKRRIATDGLLRRCTEGFQYLVTFTAPGSTAGHLQWVIGWDGKTPRPICGCERHLEDGMGRWNASASKRWNRLLSLIHI